MKQGSFLAPELDLPRENAGANGLSDFTGLVGEKDLLRL